MRTKLIQIGNSKGIRLPQTLIKQFELEDEIIIEPTEKGLFITAASGSRQGWEEQFKKAVKEESGKDNEWIDLPNRFDKEEWKW